MIVFGCPKCGYLVAWKALKMVKCDVSCPKCKTDLKDFDEISLLNEIVKQE